MFGGRTSQVFIYGGMRDRSMWSGTKLARDWIQLTDWSTAGNLSNRSSGVQMPRDICTRFGRYLYSTRCSWLIMIDIDPICLDFFWISSWTDLRTASSHSFVPFLFIRMAPRSLWFKNYNQVPEKRPENYVTVNHQCHFLWVLPDFLAQRAKQLFPLSH